MKPSDFVAKITGRLDKKSLEESLEKVITALKDETILSYISAEEWLRNYPLTSTELKNYQRSFSNGVGSRSDVGFVSVIRGALENAIKHAERLEGLVKKSFSTDVMRDGLSFAKAAMLQHIEHINFLARYSNRLLDWVYQQETIAAKSRYSVRILPGELSWLNDNRAEFFRVVKLFIMIDDREMEKRLNAASNLTISDETEQLSNNTNGIRSTDPFTMGFVRDGINPFLFIGKIIAEQQHADYEKQKLYKRMHELRLLHLKQAANGQLDPATEQQIHYLESEIQKMNAKIADWESKYA